MEFGVLGPLHVSGPQGIIDLAGGKERTLLAYLVARVGRVVGVDELVDALWPADPPRTAAKSLQTYVLRLRNALEPDRKGVPKLIVTDGPGYRLAAEEHSVDANRFARLVELGRRALQDDQVDVASTMLRDALAMWRGPAYAGFEQTRFGAAESRRLEELRRLANEDWISAELDLGRASEAVAELESLVQEQPLRERPWCLLMIGLVRTGRQADALAAYSRARDLLADELGIDPGPELRSLQVRVLAQDPLLLAPRRTTRLPAPLLHRRGRFVGREAEIALLREAWRAAASGTPTTVALRGPRRSGRTRLVAEFAAELAEAGTPIEYGESAPAEPALAPTLSVITRPRPDSLVLGARLAVMIGESEADFPPDSSTIDVPPLPAGAVRVLVSSYVDTRDLDEAVTYVARESEGWPGRVHDEALGWARRRVSERVDAAASRVQVAGADLTAVRAQLVDSVAELHEVERRADAEVAADSCPWPGLVSYDVADAPWFAGRERLVAELVARLAGPRLVGVVGPSGSGKSSLVRAGLLASLSSGSLPGSEAWTHVLVRPGQHPMRSLAVAALSGGGDRGQVGDLLERLIRGDVAGTRTVLVVDQLEEVWTACTDPAERTAFLETLGDVYHGSGGVCVVLVVRADFVARLAEHPTLSRALSDTTVLVGAPTPFELRRAIERPAGRAGLEFEVGLVDALVADAGDEPGTLPVLSTALVELWGGRDGRRLTLGTYVAMGGLSGAIARLAETAYAQLDDDDRRDTARRLLLRLTGPGVDEAVTRRRVPVAEIEGLPDRHVRSVVDAFADARLLSVSEGHIEVAHEALFREWPRLRSWLSEDAAGRAVARRLAPAASEWAAEGREKELLWRGTRLVAGIEFASDHSDELTGTEREFLEAGQDRLEAEQRADQARAAATARQNRRLRWLLVGICVLLVAAVVAGLVATQARGRAEKALTSADARRLSATALTEDYIDRGLLDAVEGVTEQQSPETLGGLLTVLSRSPAAVRVIRIPDRFFALSGAPDGSAYYAASNTGQVWKIDGRTGTATLWHHYGPRDYTQGVVVSPTGSLVAVGTASDGVPEFDIYRTSDGSRVSRFDATRLTYLHAAWSPDGSVLYVPGPDGLLAIDPMSGTQIRRTPWEPLTPGFATLAVLPDGRVVVGLARGPARLVDPRTSQVTTLPGVTPGVRASPDGRLLAEPVDGATVLWDLQSGRQVARLPQRDLTDIMAFSPDGKLLLTAGMGDTVRLWDVDSGQLREEFAGHTGKVMGAAFAPDGRTVWTAGRDGALVAWDVAGSRRLAVPGRLGFGALFGRVAADGRTAVVLDGGAPDRPSVGEIWDLNTQRKTGDLTPVSPPRPGLGTMITAITPDGKTAVSMLGDPESTEGGFLLVHDVPSGSIRRTIGLPFPAAGADLTPDGTLAVVNGDKGIGVIDLAAGTMRGDLIRSDVWSTADQEVPTTVAMSPSGRWAAVARAATVNLVDVGAGRVVATWPDTDGTDVLSLGWSVDGQTLAYGDVSGRVSFRSVPDGKELAPPRLLFPGYVLSLAASPDGKWFAAVGTDGELTLIDTASRSPVGQPLPGPTNSGWGFPIWQPDSSAVTLWYETGMTLRWEVGADRWIDRACRVAHRDLTPDEWQLLRPGVAWRPTCASLNDSPL